MYTINTLHSQILIIPPNLRSSPPPSQSPLPRSSTFLSPLCSGVGDGGGDGGVKPQRPSPPSITPPDTVEIRFRRGSRRRQKQQQEEQQISGNEVQKTMKATKKWEEMSLSEKAIEVYMGEKGLLFWLNKSAYASIFIIIGGWILFRFVGPSLNLYQLDSPPLSPTDVLKG